MELEGKKGTNVGIDKLTDQSILDNLKERTKDPKKDLSRKDKKVLNISLQNTGRYIKNLASNIVTGIQQIVHNGVINRTPNKEITNELFTHFADTNRDMRRIAAYEMVTAHNNGYIEQTKDLNKKAGIDKTYLTLNNLHGACEFCKKWEGVPVLVLDIPPEGGNDRVQDKIAKYAIWTGKNNVGRKHNEWWISASAQHPHCNCFWTTYVSPLKKVKR